MSGNSAARGWNRPNDEAKARLTARKQKSRQARGVLATLAVIVLAGGAVWLSVGPRNDNEADGERSVAKTVESGRPVTVKPVKALEAEPKLPMPKISGERIESREAIPAPQPLEQMEVALTNRLPKAKLAFKHAAEELIALATPSAPGVTVPPLPHVTDEMVARDLKQAMRNVIKAEEGDSDALLEKKLVVAEAKEEFRELREKDGWGFTEYINALRDKANGDAEFLAEAHKIAEEVYHDKSITDEDYVKYRNQLNEKLRERGLPEIDKEETQPE